MHYKRNITQLKKYEEDKPVEAETNQHEQASLEAGSEVESREEKQEHSRHQYSLRPGCNRVPEGLKDYNCDRGTLVDLFYVFKVMLFFMLVAVT